MIRPHKPNRTIVFVFVYFTFMFSSVISLITCYTNLVKFDCETFVKQPTLSNEVKCLALKARQIQIWNLTVGFSFSNSFFYWCYQNYLSEYN